MIASHHAARQSDVASSSAPDFSWPPRRPLVEVLRQWWREWWQVALVALMCVLSLWLVEQETDEAHEPK